MTDHTDDDLLRDIWKGQNMDIRTPDIETLRHRQRRLDRCSRRRNLIEYCAGGIAILLLALAGTAMLSAATTLGGRISGIGHLAVAAALVWVLARLGRYQGAARASDETLPVWTHLRTCLAAERDMLRGAWAWYVAPLLPGFAMIYGGLALEPDPNWVFLGAGAVLTAAVAIWIAWMNRRNADRLDQEIRRLEADAPQGIDAG